MRTERLYTKNFKAGSDDICSSVASDIAVYDLTKTPAENAIPATMLADLSLTTDELEDDYLAGKAQFSYQEDILRWCSYMVQQSPLARSLWEDAAAKGWSMSLTDLKGRNFHIDIPQKSFYLDHFCLTPSSLGQSVYFRNAVLCALIRVLRDIWHEERWGAFDERYNPENTLMMERVRAADCDTSVVMACWEWRGAGFADVWRHLIGADEGDMAMVFSQYLEHSPASQFSGAALTQTFRQWFEDHERVNGCDHVTLETLDDRLLDTGEHNPFGANLLTADAIEAIAELPDGTRYLKGFGNAILDDPYFSGLHDTINQTHLLHLMYDLEVVMVNNVPFRDAKLAEQIFPTDSK